MKMTEEWGLLDSISHHWLTFDMRRCVRAALLISIAIEIQLSLPISSNMCKWHKAGVRPCSRIVLASAWITVAVRRTMKLRGGVVESGNASTNIAEWKRDYGHFSLVPREHDSANDEEPYDPYPAYNDHDWSAIFVCIIIVYHKIC